MAFRVSADPIAAAGGGYEPQRKNNFTLEITPPANIQFDTEILQLTLAQMSIPTESNDRITIDFGNEKRFVAGKTTYSEETIVFNDYVDAGVYQNLVNWRKKVYNPEDGKIGRARDYKATADLFMFAPDGSTFRRWRVLGIFPSELKPGEGNMAANEQNKIEVKFSVDKMIYMGAG